MPFFTIAISLFNRENYIQRAIDSCLGQNFQDYEIIVVDDCSTDNSVNIVLGNKDPRIRLIRHEKNLGMCPARNTAFSVAKGDWFIILDSDDELLPDALTVIYKRCISADKDIGGLLFRCLWDTGETTPQPPMPAQPMDYKAFLKWLEKGVIGKTEWYRVVRKETFPNIRYPDDRAKPMLYHLNLVKRYLVLGCPETVRHYHQDTPDCVTKTGHCGSDLKQMAPARAHYDDELLSLHGEALKRFAPTVYIDYVSIAAANNFLTGNRLKGLSYILRVILHKPFSLKWYALLACGIIGPDAVIKLYDLRRKHYV